MSVTQQNPLNSYTANGATTVFPYSFLILLAADLVVQVTDTQGAVSVKTLGVDYTVNGVGNANGGNVTMLAAPANGSRVVIYRLTGLSRSTDYQQNGDLPSATLNADLDRIWLAIQELANGLQGMPMAVRAPTGETLAALPSASARAGMALVFSATGDVLVGAPATGSATDLAVNLATTNQAGKGAAMVGVRDVGNVITATNVEDALQELASGKVSKAGDTMTGPLTLSANAASNLHAVPKQQLDAATAVRMQYLTFSKATTSGTSVDFSPADSTGIPSWAKRITVSINGVSTNGSATVIVQIGTASGFVTSGYFGAIVAAPNAAANYSVNFSSGFVVSGNSASFDIRHGVMTLMVPAAGVCIMGCAAAVSNATNASTAGGSVSYSGSIDRVRLTTSNGTDVFDAGSVSLFIEG